MPNPISGGYAKPGDLGKRLDGTEKAVAQLQRLMTRPKATPKAAGVVGSTLVYPGYASVTAFSGIGTCAWSGDGGFSEPVGGDAPAVSWSGDQLVVADEGWYTFTMRNHVWWDVDGTEPTWVVAELGSDLAPIYNAKQGWGPYLTVSGTRRELQICHQFGGERLLPAGTLIYLSLQWNSEQPVQISAAQPRIEVFRRTV